MIEASWLEDRGVVEPQPQDQEPQMSEKSISPLRARMIEDMTVRNFVEKTKNDHIRHVKTFAAFLGRSPHLATPEDLRSFQLHQTETGVRPPTISDATGERIDSGEARAIHYGGGSQNLLRTSSM
jgi:hypothetical protein